MNINYLINEILPVRKQEIEEGKNLGTSQPIYVVLSLMEHVCEGHTDYLSHMTNNKGKERVYGYIDMGIEEPECREFKESDKGMENAEAVTLFWTDDVKAFFLTSEAAHAYLKYQSHNMKEPYVYVYHSGYSNYQMDRLLKGE